MNINIKWFVQFLYKSVCIEKRHSQNKNWKNIRRQRPNNDFKHGQSIYCINFLTLFKIRGKSINPLATLLIRLALEFHLAGFVNRALKLPPLVKVGGCKGGKLIYDTANYVFLTVISTQRRVGGGGKGEMLRG